MWDCGRCGRCGERQRHTATQTAVTNIHFASAMPHAKCNYSSQARNEQQRLQWYTARSGIEDTDKTDETKQGVDSREADRIYPCIYGLTLVT